MSSQTMANGDNSSQTIDVRASSSVRECITATAPLFHASFLSEPGCRLQRGCIPLFSHVLLLMCHSFQHLTSYPVVSDAISTFKSNPYGKKSLDLSNTGYEKLVAPFVPYAKRPYGYVAPYVAKADSLGSDALSRVDHTFPIVKENTEKIKGTVLDYAYFPFRLVGDSKNYVLDTYSSEYKKCGGDGYVAGSKAMITTGLVVTSDTLSWLSTFLGQKKEEGTDYAAKKYGTASNYAHDKSGQAMQYAEAKSEQAKNLAYQKKGQGKDMAANAKDMAFQKTDEGKDMAANAKDTTQAKGNEAKDTAQSKGKEAKDTAKEKSGNK